MDDYYFQSLVNTVAEQLKGIYLSQILLVFIYSALLVLIPGYIRIIRKGDITWSEVIKRYFWFAYVLIVLLITIFRRGAGAKEFKISTRLYFGGFHGGMYSLRQFVYCVLNVLLFVPFGILSRLLRKDESNVRAFIMTVLMSFIFTVLIEVFQLATRSGYFEVTDIVTNLTGGIIGAIVGTLISAAFKDNNRNEQKKQQ